MKQSPHYVKYWIDKYITALLDAIGAAALLGLETEKRQLFEMSRNAMGLTSPAKSDTMQSGAEKTGTNRNGGKTMKRYEEAANYKEAGITSYGEILADCKEIARTDSELRDSMIEQCGSIEEYAREIFDSME